MTRKEYFYRYYGVIEEDIKGIPVCTAEQYKDLYHIADEIIGHWDSKTIRWHLVYNNDFETLGWVKERL